MILIKNARILQFDPPVYTEPCTIQIDGTRITEVFDQEDERSSRRTPANGASVTEPVTEIDAGGRIVMPGPVCGHHHFYSWLARGMTVSIGPTPDFISILKQVWWRLDRALTRETMEATAGIAALETIKSGTTAVIDHHASPGYIDGSLSVLAEGFRAAGLRGVLCYETTDRHGREGMRAGVAENARFAAEVRSDPAAGDRLLEAAVGAHAPFTLDDESLSLLAETVRSTGAGLHIHVAEDRFDASHSRLAYGKELIERLESFGLLTRKTIIAHAIHLVTDDITRINAADATLAHNCRSNMNNGVGYNARLPEFNRVTIGTDGIGSSMFEELKFAFFKHRDAGGTLGPDAFVRFLGNNNEVLERCFERPFGRIETGGTADLVISDYRPPTPLSAENGAGHMLYGMYSGDISTSIVNGRVVMREHQIATGIDEEAVYARAREAARALWKEMNRLVP